MNAKRKNAIQGHRLRFGDATGSVFSGFVQQMAIVVSGVLVARLLGAENRGHLALLALIPTVLSQVGTLGIPAAITYYQARYVASTVGLLRSVAGVLVGVTVGLLVCNAVLIAALLVDEDSSVWLAAIVAMLALPGVVAQLLGLSILQGQHRFVAFNTLRTLQFLVYSFLVAVFFAINTDSLLLIASAWSASTWMSGLLTLSTALLYDPHPDSHEAPQRSEIVRFGLRSLPSLVSPVEGLRLDQFVVGIFLGPAALGFYVVAFAFTNLPRFVAHGIGNVAYPKIATLSQGELKATFRFMLLAAGACGAILLITQAAVGWAVPFFFGAEFSASIGMARILLFSAFLFSMRRVLNDCVRGMGRPEWGAIAEVTSWVALVPALALLLPGNGAEGVAWALVAASAVGLCALGYLTIRNDGARQAKSSIEQLEAALPAA